MYEIPKGDLSSHTFADIAIEDLGVKIQIHQISSHYLCTTDTSMTFLILRSGVYNLKKLNSQQSQLMRRTLFFPLSRDIFKGLMEENKSIIPNSNVINHCTLWSRNARGSSLNIVDAYSKAVPAEAILKSVRHTLCIPCRAGGYNKGQNKLARSSVSLAFSLPLSASSQFEIQTSGFKLAQ